MFIALEGIDGVGKSTVAARLGQRLGAEVLRVPPAEYGLTGEYLDEDPTSMAHFAFYLSAALLTSDRVATIRALGGKVVADRYVHSTYAYHAPFVDPIVPADRLEVEKPDLTVLLTVAEPERQRRLTRRSVARALIERILDDDETRGTVLAAFRSNPDIVEIDTTGLTVDQVVSEIEELGGVGRP